MQGTSTWQQHIKKWEHCQLCPLSKQRYRICLARGTLPCRLLFIGEAPGMSEDTIGQPFVGPAGQLLDQIIERSIPTEIAYAFTNLVACFPREAKEEGVNEPKYDEILKCRPRLIEFVNIARPQLIVCVGSLSSRFVVHNDSVPCIDIVHPAAILRMPLVQRQMASHKCIIQIRNGIDKVLSDSKPFIKWGDSYTSITKHDSTLPF